MFKQHTASIQSSSISPHTAHLHPLMALAALWFSILDVLSLFSFMQGKSSRRFCSVSAAFYPSWILLRSIRTAVCTCAVFFSHLFSFLFLSLCYTLGVERGLTFYVSVLHLSSDLNTSLLVSSHYWLVLRPVCWSSPTDERLFLWIKLLWTF